MSRREDRSSVPKRHRSRFDREPSPKRSRRDVKPETERPPVEPDLDKDRLDRGHRHPRRLQDALPLESGKASRESEKEADGHIGVARNSSDQTKMPRSLSYFQHDDRGSAGQNGRGFKRRTDSERGLWCDSKEQRNVRSIDRTASVDSQKRDEKSKYDREGRHVWRHDGYFEMEANPKLPPRRRPAFREQKIPSDPDRTDKTADGQDYAIDHGRRNERGCNPNPRYSYRPVAGQRELRGTFDRSNANSRSRGGDRFSGGQIYPPTGGRVEKWKHDLYDEANKSPPPKNEEDQLSKIEALLTS